MPATFSDYQDATNPMDGRVVRLRSDWDEIVSACAGREPFVVALDHDGGASLLVALGGSVNAVQHTDAAGVPTIALAPGPPLRDADVEFLCGGTPTPFRSRWLLTPTTTGDLVAYFLATGERAPTAVWEAI